MNLLFWIIRKKNFGHKIFVMNIWIKRILRKGVVLHNLCRHSIFSELVVLSTIFTIFDVFSYMKFNSCKKNSKNFNKYIEIFSKCLKNQCFLLLGKNGQYFDHSLWYRFQKHQSCESVNTTKNLIRWTCAHKIIFKMWSCE